MTTQAKHFRHCLGAPLFFRGLFTVSVVVASVFFATTSWAGALHDAAEAGNLTQIQQLVASGADVNEVDARGIWPLLAATTNGNVTTVALLLKLNANPNQTDRYHYSALHEAASLGYADVLKLLIAANADINARDINGITPLGYALRSSPNPKAMALLQSAGGIQ